MLGQTQDPLLQKTEQAIQAKVAPDSQQAFQRIVTAGLKVMYSPETHDLMVKQLGANGDPAEMAGAGAAKLLGILFKQSKGTMPMSGAIPAATVLLCEGLDFMEKSGKVKVTSDLISAAMKALSANLLQLFGATPQKLQNILSNGAQADKNAPQGSAQPPQATQAAPSAPPQQAAPTGIIAGVKA